VYSKYAERCGTERVIPLNPASFGKLVRVIFPNIQTRRLGVRGESKYHYVDLELLMDSEVAEDARPGTGHQQQPGLRRQSSIGPKLDFKYVLF
jgi:regulatory factor X